MDNNCQALTRDHKTCRFQWVFERFVSPRRFVTGDTDAAPQSGTFHSVPRSRTSAKQIVLHAVYKMVDTFVSRTTVLAVQAEGTNHLKVL